MNKWGELEEKANLLIGLIGDLHLLGGKFLIYNEQEYRQFIQKGI